MKVCPRCGAKESDKQFIGQFCVDCYLSDHPEIVRFPKLSVPVCVHCGRIKVAGRWVEPSEDAITHFLAKKMKTDLSTPRVNIVDLSVFPSQLDVKVRVCGEIEGSQVCVDKDVRIAIKKTQCPVCTKSHGEYWELKVQIRGNKDLVEAALDDALKMIDSLAKKDARARILQVKKLKEGVDLLIGSKKIGRDIVKRLRNKFNARVIRTRKLTGEDVHKGKRVYKETFSVRLG